MVIRADRSGALVHQVLTRVLFLLLCDDVVVDESGIRQTHSTVIQHVGPVLLLVAFMSRVVYHCAIDRVRLWLQSVARSRLVRCVLAEVRRRALLLQLLLLVAVVFELLARALGRGHVRLRAALAGHSA